MSRDLEPSEKATFTRLYGTGERCRKCGGGTVTIRIWEGYASPAKTVGGDLGPDSIVAAVVICGDCGHGETVPRSDIRRAGKAA